MLVALSPEISTSPQPNTAWHRGQQGCSVQARMWQWFNAASAHTARWMRARSRQWHQHRRGCGCNNTGHWVRNAAASWWEHHSQVCGWGDTCSISCFLTLPSGRWLQAAFLVSLIRSQLFRKKNNSRHPVAIFPSPDDCRAGKLHPALSPSLCWPRPDAAPGAAPARLPGSEQAQQSRDGLGSLEILGEKPTCISPL